MIRLVTHGPRFVASAGVVEAAERAKTWCLPSFDARHMTTGRSKMNWAILTLVVLGFAAGTSEASDPKADQETQPTLGERTAKDPVKGTLLRRDGEFYWIKDATDEKEVKLHVDSNTTIDKLVSGDRIKASVTESGHVTTLQRDE